MSVPLKRLIFLFCSLGVMFLAGWEAAKMKNSFRGTAQESARMSDGRIQEDAGAAGETEENGAGSDGGEQPRVALTFDDGPNREFTGGAVGRTERTECPGDFFSSGTES